MRVQVVGDGFIPTSDFVEELGARVPDADVRAIALPGDQQSQHAAQQIMEVGGANAVTVPDEVLTAVSDAEVLCVHFAPVGAQLLEAAPDLKLVAVARTGLENVDVEAATARGTGVVGVYGRNASAVAELQIGLILAEARNISRADASIRAGGWRKDFPGPRIELGGRTVGMIGFGHVGRHFVKKLIGFECRLLAYDPYGADHPGVTRVSTLDEIFAESDYVVVQARHTAETDRFIGAEQFALMKPGAYFINVARSRLVDTDALYEALAAGQIAGAGLDVFDAEPLPEDSPWRQLDNVTMTTHFGGDTEETNRTSAALVAEAVAEFDATGRVGAAVNAEALGW